MRARTFSSYDLLHMHTLGAGALTRAVSLHRHMQMSASCCSQKMIQGHAYYCALSPSQRAAACARQLLSLRGSYFTNCPLAGRVVVGIRMGVVRPEQGKLQEPLVYFGKRVARLALFRCKCPRCTSGMIKCTSAKLLAPRLHITFE